VTAPDVDLEKAALHAAGMLAALGITGDTSTPDRFVRALDELARHRGTDPARHLGVRFPGEGGSNVMLVSVSDIPFVSLCEHHLLPFTGVATVAYLPQAGGRDSIVGLSKLARLVRELAARPQIQERLTHQVAATLMTTVRPQGAACAIRATHSCMSLRGACAGPDASMVTTQHLGVLRDPPWRDDFQTRLTTAAWR
jgi:GTP cyclohydrolase IA